MIATKTTQHASDAKTVLSMPRLMLQAEGLALFILATGIYVHFVGDWVLFGVLLLSPDLTMVGYLANPKIGAIVYNLVHTIIAPIVLGVLSMAVGWQLGFALALILAAHIGMDRAVGYGLKYGDAFKRTHIGAV